MDAVPARPCPAATTSTAALRRHLCSRSASPNGLWRDLVDPSRWEWSLGLGRVLGLRPRGCGRGGLLGSGYGAGSHDRGGQDSRHSQKPPTSVAGALPAFALGLWEICLERRSAFPLLLLGGGGGGLLERGGKGGVWDPKVCVPKMAPQDFPNFVFSHDGHFGLRGGGGGQAGVPPFLLWCLVILIPPWGRGWAKAWTTHRCRG